MRLYKSNGVKFSSAVNRFLYLDSNADGDGMGSECSLALESLFSVWNLSSVEDTLVRLWRRFSLSLETSDVPFESLLSLFLFVLINCETRSCSLPDKELGVVGVDGEDDTTADSEFVDGTSGLDIGSLEIRCYLKRRIE